MTSWDFQRGAKAVLATADIANQLTTDEVRKVGGPDFMAGEDTDEAPAFHQGWDWQIRQCRIERVNS